MSNIILIKGGRIRFPTGIESISEDYIRMSMEEWITPKGLLIPLGRASLEMREHLIDPTYQPDINYAEQVTGCLVRTDGRLFLTEFVGVPGSRGKLRPLLMVRPVLKTSQWSFCTNRVARQAGVVMLDLYDDLGSVMDKLNHIEPMVQDCYGEWDYATLVKHVQVEVERLYPGEPETTPGRGVTGA